MPVALFEVLFDFPRIGRVPLCPWTCFWIFRLLSSVFYLGGDRVDSLLHMDVFDRQEEAGETNVANSRFAGSNTLSTGKGIKVGSTISRPILLQSQSLSSFSYTKVWWCTARILWVQFPGPAASCVRGLTLASPETTGVGCSASTNLSPGTEVGSIDQPLIFFPPSVTEGHGKAWEATWTAAWSVCQLT